MENVEKVGKLVEAYIHAKIPEGKESYCFRNHLTEKETQLFNQVLDIKLMRIAEGR